MNRKTPLFAAAVCLFAAASIQAQEVRASLSGIITDPSGAPIPAAKITVTNLAKNTSVVSASNDSGRRCWNRPPTASPSKRMASAASFAAMSCCSRSTKRASTFSCRSAP
jgi:hypothetical protein